MKLAPEAAFVLASLRARYSGDTTELKQATSHALDWSEVAEVARQHGVTTLVYRDLRELPKESVPAGALSELRARVEQNRVRNLEQSAELLRVLERLQDAGIEAVPYKGPVLASEVYGDVALREFVDLDILVEPRHVTR